MPSTTPAHHVAHVHLAPTGRRSAARRARRPPRRPCSRRRARCRRCRWPRPRPAAPGWGGCGSRAPAPARRPRTAAAAPRRPRPRPGPRITCGARVGSRLQQVPRATCTSSARSTGCRRGPPRPTTAGGRAARPAAPPRRARGSRPAPPARAETAPGSPASAAVQAAAPAAPAPLTPRGSVARAKIASTLRRCASRSKHAASASARQPAGHARVGLERRAERRTALERRQRVLLHDAVGLLARHPRLGQRQQHALREHEPAARVEVARASPPGPRAAPPAPRRARRP